MSSNEISWLDLVKEHKWKIIVAAICIFAGIAYFSMANKPVPDASFDSANSGTQTFATPSATSTATGTATPSVIASATPTVPAVSVGTGQQAPTPKDWKPVANAFAKAWANPKAGQEAWLNALKPTVTSDLYDQFTTTDVGRVSQLEVSGINSEQEDYRGVNARVSFKNTEFTILIHLTPQADMTWLVSVVTSS